MQRPNRPPDISTLIQLPTDEAIEHLHKVSFDHPDSDIRLLAAIVARLCPSVESIAKALPGIARGDFVSLDPDVEAKGSK